MLWKNQGLATLPSYVVHALPGKRISYELAKLSGYEEVNLHEGKSISCLHHLVKYKVWIKLSN